MDGELTMNTREKLIELFEQEYNRCEDTLCSDCKYDAYKDCGLHALVDHLIANGVTAGKPLTEYLHPVDNYAGLKGKYLVFKADTGEQVSNCFVLRPDKDTAAVEALRAYANTTDNKTLAEDIYNWVGKGVTIQKWIPVTERLPEDGEHLAFVKHTYGKYIRLLRFAKDGRKVDKYDFHRGWKNVWYYYDSEWGHITIDDVTHWMPLPEPPETK